MKIKKYEDEKCYKITIKIEVKLKSWKLRRPCKIRTSSFREHTPIKGGGIYIKWRGTGLVIDPGINFMENMHMSGLGINDIDAVIVTHNHIDHNGDLITIDDLAFQFNKCGISLYMDKQTEQEFDRRLKNSMISMGWI